MRRAILLSPYFTPSNLAGVQRTRLMSSHLADFGWEPIVVTVDPGSYEEPADNASMALLPEQLRVERVTAWSAKFCRPFGVGDISLRGQWSLRRKVEELVREVKPDLIFATVLPGYTSLIGAWAKRKFGLPFVLDYQDPWVCDAGAKKPRFSKAGLAHWLALKLEPKVVPLAEALTAVSDETLNTLRERQLIRNGTVIRIIPIGAEKRDHEVAKQIGKNCIVKKAGVLEVMYLGTLTDRMLPALRAFLAAMKECYQKGVQIRFHLIGTSAQAAGQDTLGVERIIQEMGAADLVELKPQRIPYLDALRTMQNADLLLLLGSTDTHYTASKLFPYWLSARPMLALFHAASTVIELARELGGVRVVSYDDAPGPATRTREVADVLEDLAQNGCSAMPVRNEAAFEPYSATGVARKYAELFDHVISAPSAISA
jgi:hypothetical protein